MLKAILACVLSSCICGMAAYGQVATAGTLVLVIADQNGFIIASDSRRSNLAQRFSCGDTREFYCDDSQKVFQTGKKSAIAIAGFSSWLKGTPLDLEVASVLRRRYKYASVQQFTPPKGARPIGTMGPVYVTKFTPFDPQSSLNEDFELEEALTTVAAFALPANFSTLIAKLDGKGEPQVNRIDYQYAPVTGGPLSIVIPDYQASDVTKQSCRTRPRTTDDLKMDVFKFCTAGMDGLAKKILSGDYPTTDKVIQKYYRALRENKLDKMPLSQLSALAQAILAETGQSNYARAPIVDGGSVESFSVVGGPDQVGVFPSRGDVRCCGDEQLPTNVQLLPPKFIRAGFVYDGTEDGSPVNPVRISFFWSGQYDPDEPIHQVFIGDYFRNITVVLDGNYFMHNQFDNVTFRYEGGECFMPSWPENRISNCGLEIFVSLKLPDSCSGLSSCRRVGYGSTTSKATVGAPIRVETSKCREPHPDGTVTFWVGGECGNVAGMMGPVIK